MAQWKSAPKPSGPSMMDVSIAEGSKCPLMSFYYAEKTGWLGTQSTCKQSRWALPCEHTVTREMKDNTLCFIHNVAVI